jgi:hypothetical protein
LCGFGAQIRAPRSAAQICAPRLWEGGAQLAKQQELSSFGVQICAPRSRLWEGLDIERQNELLRFGARICAPRSAAQIRRQQGCERGSTSNDDMSFCATEIDRVRFFHKRKRPSAFFSQTKATKCVFVRYA